MKVILHRYYCRVVREKGDPVFKGGTWGDGESRLLYWVKRILNKKGLNLIKKRMWKDGHLVDSHQQYLRTRSPRCPKPHIIIVNDQWVIRGADTMFNNDGVVELRVWRDVFTKE